MIILNIACVIGVLVICLAGSIGMLFVLWGILWVLEKLVKNLFTSKKCDSARGQTYPKFKFRKHPIQFIKCFKGINNCIKSNKIFRDIWVYFPTWGGHQIRYNVDKYQTSHRDTETQTNNECSLMPSHADTLPQDKNGINHKQTEP
jgi:hypothetical protein